jgi:hypothetical protein
MSILETIESSMGKLPPGVLGPAVAEDLDGVVRLHLRAFPDTFITPFGPRFIRLYYEALLSFPGSIFVVYRDDSNCICGIVAGARSPRQFHLFLLRRYSVRAMAALLTSRPGPILNMGRRMARKLFVGTEADAGVRADAECMVMAVDTSLRDPSIAAYLTAAFLRGAQARGATSILSGIRVDNPRLLRFAHLFGYRDVRREPRPDGHEMQILLWSQSER